MFTIKTPEHSLIASVQELDQNSRFITRMVKLLGPCLWARVYSVVVGASVRCPSGCSPRCPAAPSPGSGYSRMSTVSLRSWPSGFSAETSSWAGYSRSEEGTCRTRYISEQSLVPLHTWQSKHEIWVKKWAIINWLRYRAVSESKDKIGV